MGHSAVAPTSEVIGRLSKHVDQINAGEIEGVCPGQPTSFTAACTAGDAIAQGDLNLVITSGKIPEDYVKVEFTGQATDAQHLQLVPGNTQGAKHCLDSLDGVTMWRPAKWDMESLVGPILKLTKDRTVLHPTHGAVTMLAGTTVHCRYQREWEKEEAKERRARD
jgi:hypothetical protein